VSHKHAELMAMYAEDARETDKPWERWELHNPGGLWHSMASHPLWFERTNYRRKPQPKVIDWSQLGKHVPVKVWDEARVFAGGYIRFLHELFDGSEPFGDGLDTWECASLDTGLWVYNHDGKNPWPEGVIVEVQFRDGSKYIRPADELTIWRVDFDSRAPVVASRFHSLEPGYRFEGES